MNTSSDPLVEDIGATSQFFVDDAIIAASRGLARRFHQASKPDGNPVVRKTDSYEGTYLSPVTVLPDLKGGGYRMWYMSLAKQPIAGIQSSFLHTALSDDGIHWNKPALGLCSIGDDTGNNINVFADGTPLRSGRRVFRDDAEPDPAKRYKMMFYLPNYYLATSPDGRTWTPAQEDPVWPNGAGQGLEETSFFLRDPLRGSYRGYVRIWQRHQTVRTLGLGESDDLVHWSGPQIIWRAGPEFGPGAQIYGMNVFIDGGVYWGAPWMCYTDEPLDPSRHQTMHLKLAWSRDGIEWSAVCPEQDLVPMGTDGAFDSQMMLTICPVVDMGDRLRLYYFGSDARHDAGAYRSAIGLAEMRKGGFVSLRADGEGRLLTRRFLFKGEALHINARTDKGGCVAAEILNDGGGVIPRFSFDNSDVFEGDAVDHGLSWGGQTNLSSLTGQNLMLRLKLEAADLFSFRVSGPERNFTKPLGPAPVRCGRVLRAPMIDGVLNDECWADFSRTGIADDFSDFKEARPATIRTRVSMTYDEENLYVGVDCEEPRTEQLRAQCDESTKSYSFKKDDTIEIRLNAPGQGTFFNQLCLNAAGKRFQAWFSVEEGGSRVLDRVEWTAATSVTEGHWYAEMAVPFSALQADTPRPGDRWQLNILRFRHTEGDDVSCWSCMFGSVHRNDLSGTLVFSE